MRNGRVGKGDWDGGEFYKFIIFLVESSYNKSYANFKWNLNFA